MMSCQLSGVAKSLFFLTVSSILSALASPTVNAEVPTNLEPEFSEAVLAFNGKNYGRSLQILDELLKQAPLTTEFLELKALTLKSAQKTKESAKVYLSLIKAKKKQKVKDKELAPYYFELGLIRFREKKDKPAKAYLMRSAHHGFNSDASNFFIGILSFRNGDWKDAEAAFNKVVQSPSKDLKVPSHFYIAQINIKTGYPQGATQSFIKAKEHAEEILNDPDAGREAKRVAKEIQTASEKALKPLDKSRFFGNLSLLTSYDSNVLFFPTSVEGASASGKSTLKETLQLGFGYMSSPSKTFQWVPNYRLSYNYNFNKDSREGEFFSQFLSLYLTRKPLSSTNYGVKLEGTLTFQRKVDLNDNSKFEAFNLTGSFGPYFRTKLKKKLTLNLEASISPQKYFDDSSSTAESKRSGPLYGLSAAIQNDTGDRYFNPNGSLSLTINNTTGSEFRARTIALSLNNAMYLTKRDKVTLGPSVSFANFSDRAAGARKDTTLSFQAAYTRKLSRLFTLLSDISFTKNSSNVPEQYQYDRFVFSAGVSYSLF